MRFYAAVWQDDEPTAGNLEWFTNRRDAEREASAAGGHVCYIEIEPTKRGLKEFLDKNLWRANHVAGLRLA